MQVNVDIKKAITFSILPTSFWVSVILFGLFFIPDRAWYIKYYEVLVSLTVIGLWRYAWQLLQICRSYYYEYKIFPAMRSTADDLVDKYPKNLFIIVASYHEDKVVTQECFSSIVSEAEQITSNATILASVGSKEEAEVIKSVVGDRVRLLFTIQENGKRYALAHALSVIAGEEREEDDLVVLMDGDVALCQGVLLKSLPIFKLNPSLGAATTNNICVCLPGCSFFSRSWYTLRMVKRHHYMMSQALSKRVLTLTGRFSIFRSPIVTDPEFIDNLANDHLDHWLFGKFRFLMGDDKSSMCHLLKNDWETTYIPDAYVCSIEDRKDKFFGLASSLMHRWYGNMLRVNGRACALGFNRMPFFIWWCFVDQRISMWTTLIGPVAAIALSIFVSGYYLIFYILWVILTRLLFLWFVAILHGHYFKVIDLLLVVFEQWYGSMIKIYSSLNLDEQTWNKSSSQSIIVKNSVLQKVLPTILLILYFSIFLLFISLLTGLLKLPNLI